MAMGRKPNVVVLAKETGEFELLNISGELVQEAKCESQRKIQTHGESSHAEQYEPVNILGESVKEAKCKTETKIETHEENYEPVKAKPISTKVFYKQWSKRQADSLASEMAKEEDRSKLGK